MIQANQQNGIIPSSKIVHQPKLSVPKEKPMPNRGSIQMGGQLSQKKKVSTTNNRKRSVETRPHPPHLLNKRYWDDVRAQGKATQSSSPESSFLLDSINKVKQPKMELMAAQKTEAREQMSSFEITGSRQQQKEPFPKAVKSTVQDPNICSPFNGGMSMPIDIRLSPHQQQPQTAIPSGHGFPQKPSFFPSLSNSSTSGLLPLDPLSTSVHFPTLSAHSSLADLTTHFMPPPLFISPSLFSIPPPLPLPMPSQLMNGPHHHQAAALGSAALLLLVEIFRKQQDAEKTRIAERAADEGMGHMSHQRHEQFQIEYSRPSNDTESDAQIDRILDEMVMGDESRRQQELNHAHPNQRLCILPIPILVPIPFPLSADFITKHYGLQPSKFTKSPLILEYPTLEQKKTTD